MVGAERREIWHNFGIAGITMDVMKFNTVVASVESNVLVQISDVILQPSETGKKDHLKKWILERYCDIKQEKYRNCFRTTIWVIVALRSF